jgi:BRCA1/BRCA2-containing complex subunit 3
MVDRILLSADTFSALMSHSFVTDCEEILGLLFGDYDGKIVRIWGLHSLIRNCKEKDRVEVEPLQLSSAMNRAEELSSSLGQDSSLKGWYHSHPNITIWPSHVDLRTQLSMQQLGGEFIGIIFSCFSRDNQLYEKVNLIGFRTDPETQQGITIPIDIVSGFKLLKNPEMLEIHDSFYHLLEVQKNLMAEEQKAYYEAQANSQHILGRIYNSSQFNISMSRLLEESLLPLYEYIQQKQTMDSIRLEQILKENEILEQELKSKRSRVSQ